MNDPRPLPIGGLGATARRFDKVLVMGEWGVLADILILLAAALAMGTVAEMLRQHAIVGYLIAGMLVGPEVLGWVGGGEHAGGVKLIAELGVTLLLFTIGLEFSFKRLRAMGRLALVGGSVQVVGTAAVFAVIAGAFGLPIPAALGLGLMAAMSSTASVLRMLRDRAELEAIHGRMTMATLLMQDALLLPAILVVTALRGGGGFMGAVTTMGVTVGFAGGMVAVFFVLFRWIAPRLLHLRSLAGNRELPILLAVVMALGAALAAHTLHISPAVGAFVAGVILGESAFAAQIRADIASIRTVLLTLFFASIGMLGDPQWAAMHWPLVATVLLAVLAGKALIVAGVGRLMRLPWSVGIAAGLCLAQVGEFSFVLAELAVMDITTGEGEPPIPTLIDEHMFKLVISVTILTLLVTPYFISLAPTVEKRLRRRFRKSAVVIGASDGGPDGGESAPILIIGFGPAGQRVAEALIGRERTRLVVIDTNPRNAKIAERYGLHAVVGDARQADLLEHAGVHEAIAAVVTLPVADASREVIALLRRMKPELGIAARARHHVFRWELELAGADLVIDEEDQMGLRLAAELRSLLRTRDVGSSPDEPEQS